MTRPLDRLAEVLRTEGGLLGAAVRAADAPTPLGDRAGVGRAFAVEAIREGHLLHHAGRPQAQRPRIVATEDADLALLAGDRLFALGLAELAAAGDLEAVRVMAEVIATSATALATGDEVAAETAWDQGIRALAGPGEPPPTADR